MSVAALSKSLPKPKYTGEEEELRDSRAARVLSAEQYETQIVKKQNGPPAYGQRTGWRPRAADDFGKQITLKQQPRHGTKPCERSALHGSSHLVIPWRNGFSNAIEPTLTL